MRTHPLGALFCLLAYGLCILSGNTSRAGAPNQNPGKTRDNAEKQLSFENSRRALLELLESDFQKQIEKHTKNGDVVKAFLDGFASRMAKNEIKTGEIVVEDGIGVISGWHLVPRELKFYAVLENAREHVILNGKYTLSKDDKWMASLDGIKWALRARK